MVKKRPRTAELRKVNDSAKEAAEVIVQNSAGRPPKYHPHFVHMINCLADGLVSSTNYQIAQMFGVDEVGTIERWLKDHAPFREAVQRARSKVDQQVERALFERATGYKHEEVKVFCAPRTGEIVTHRVMAHYPPDTKALQFWLGNRHPDRWRNRPDELTNMNPNDAAAEVRAALAEMDDLTHGGSK